MASSDDEGEAVPQAVSNYHFVDDKDEPISFSELPFKWEEGGGPDGRGKQIFLHGTTDNGLQKIYKQVVGWKFDEVIFLLFSPHPLFFVSFDSICLFIYFWWECALVWAGCWN